MGGDFAHVLVNFAPVRWSEKEQPGGSNENWGEEGPCETGPSNFLRNQTNWGELVKKVELRKRLLDEIVNGGKQLGGRS